EVAGPGQEEYGLERLMTAVRQRIDLPTGRLFDELLAEARHYSGSYDFPDDVCLVGMEIAQLGTTCA
ncbi:MAG TPA: hypothetical protein VNZ22_12100, partial [Bacillota bacterium]|nr:hypothetical protein [Bacillota bacterium]